MDLMRSRERGSFTSMKFWESIVIPEDEAEDYVSSREAMDRCGGLRVQRSAAFRVWDPVLGSEWCSEAMTHQLDVHVLHDV